MSGSYDRKIFAANLRRLMEAQGVRQSELARILGVSRATVSAYCSAEQMPRMDKVEELSRYFAVGLSELLENSDSADIHPAVRTYERLSPQGREEFLDYGEELLEREQGSKVIMIKHYLVPAAAGYASPIQGEDYELIPLPAGAPAGADFCISIDGDSMEPYIPNGSMVYVRRDSPLSEFDVGVFFVDGDDGFERGWSSMGTPKSFAMSLVASSLSTAR